MKKTSKMRIAIKIKSPKKLHEVWSEMDGKIS